MRRQVLNVTWAEADRLVAAQNLHARPTVDPDGWACDEAGLRADLVAILGEDVVEKLYLATTRVVAHADLTNIPRLTEEPEEETACET